MLRDFAEFKEPGAQPYVCSGAEHPSFCIEAGGSRASSIHIAFVARNRLSVDAFHAAALAAGGLDNGPPGLRLKYHENYYGAFVCDPDGRNIEAVRHLPEGEITVTWPGSS